MSEYKQRTDQQRKSLEVFCKLLAESLNLAGLEMKMVLKPSYKIWWTQESVKENLFKPLLKAKFGYNSTTEARKIGDLDETHQDLMRILGEKFGLEYIDWPHKEINETNYRQEADKLKINYPNGKD